MKWVQSFRFSSLSIVLLLIAETIRCLCPLGCALSALCPRAEAASPGPPTAVQGRIDVSSWNFAEGNLPLSGAWELYFGQLVEPGDFAHTAPVDGGRPTPLYAPVPGSWASVRTEEGPLPGLGAATYRLLITGLPQARSTPWALEIPYARTAYRLWVNDQLVASNGTVSLLPEETQPQYKPAIVPLTGVAPASTGGDGETDFKSSTSPLPKTIEIVMQVSNGHFRAGGIPRSPILGPMEQVLRDHQRRLVFQMFLTGSLTLMALYFALVYLWRRAERPILYFALLSGTVAVRSFFTGELPFAVYMPNFSWHLLLRIEYFTSYFGPLALMLFLHALFPHDVSRIVRDVSVALGGAGSILSVILPVRYSSVAIPYYTVVAAALIPYVAFVLVQAARKKREAAQLTLAGGLIFLIAVALSMLHYNQLWVESDWVPVGLFALLLSQAFALSRRSALAFQQATDLARQNGLLLEETRRRLAERNRLYRLLIQRDEQTRRSIAELLHGRVQALLFSASQSAMEAAAAVQRDAQEAIRLMKLVHDTVEQVREREIREASHRLHPPAIRAGLVGALESLCSRRHHLAIEFSVDPALTFLDDPGGLRLKDAVRLGFYRVLEEALNNVERHASARRVQVSLRLVPSPRHSPSNDDPSSEPDSRNAWMELTVIDDGVGFDPDTTSFGLGLQLIAARAADLNGEWEVSSNPGSGTRLRIIAPLEFV